jgi:Bardet-Biedl syndrome 7 protein
MLIEIKDESIYNVLELLRPELDKYSSLERKHRLLEPLAEIKTHEEDCSFLSEEYKSIIENAESIKRV